MYLNWQAWTAVGLLAGTGLSNVADWGLDFAMAVTFIGIVVPLVTTRPMLLCALVSGAVAMLAAGLPHNLGLIVAALAGMSAGVILESLARPARGSPPPRPPAQEPPADGRVPD
jgi:predicted branched-subunit amino acid permease